MEHKGVPLIMGILNVTPDSFYDGGKYSSTEIALKRIEKMIEEGADIIDIGGESTRPGAMPVREEEEMIRVIPLIEKCFDTIPEIRNGKVKVSIDTYKSSVAKKCLERGVHIVNDISAGRFDKEMVNIVKNFNVSVVIMHMKGTPQNMQIAPFYKNIMKELKEFFIERIDYFVSRGIDEKNIIIDPGIGFGKTTEHNLVILSEIDSLKELNKKILVGTSRKSFIGKILGSEEKPVPVEERLSGSIATYVYLGIKNVDILRVHDVKETKMALKVLERIINATS